MTCLQSGILNVLNTIQYLCGLHQKQIPMCGTSNIKHATRLKNTHTIGVLSIILYHYKCDINLHYYHFVMP